MDFIEAVIAISKRPDLEICDYPDERSGMIDVCVHKGTEFIGKLRWPSYPRNRTNAVFSAEADDSLIDELKKGSG